MTRSKPGNLHPYDPEIDKTFHKLSRSNRSVVVHDSVILDSSIVHIEFIVDFISELAFIASIFEISVHIMVDNNQTLKEWATPNIVYQPWCIQYPKTKVSYEPKCNPFVSRVSWSCR